jgi:hypothetical protein
MYKSFLNVSSSFLNLSNYHIATKFQNGGGGKAHKEFFSSIFVSQTNIYMINTI